MSPFSADSPIVDHVRASPNHDARGDGPVDILLLHYTGMASTPAALERLCEAAAKVSSHYLVDEAGKVVQLVPEARRAWHAGISSWEGMTDINSRSIGIEIGNPGHSFGYPDFFDEQISAVIALCSDVIARHPIRPHRVLAHSDVAPLRKADPGEKFPWERLYRAGIGLWTKPVPVNDFDGGEPVAAGVSLLDMQRALKHYGYGIEPTGEHDELSVAVVTAFQRHFRPARVDGRVDRSTAATLQALLAARGD